MPVHVKCPGCGSVLAAPEQLAGGVMSCPQCKNQFMVPKAGAATPAQPPSPPLAKLPASGNGGPPPPPAPSGRVSLASLARQSAPTTAGPPPVATASVAKAAAPPTGAASSSTAAPANRGNYYPPGDFAAPPTASPAPVAPAPLSAPSAMPIARAPAPATESSATLSPVTVAPKPTAAVAASSPMYPPGFEPVAPAPPVIPAKQPSFKPAATPQRQVQAAKFISGDTSATRIDLGADGKLPELKLDTVTDKDDPDEKVQASNPWILIGLLGFSVLASVVMLFFEPGSSSANSTTKTEARRYIENFYLAKDKPEEPYQRRLRDALLAHNRGDAAEEKRLYREVLDMMRSESVRNTNKGLTGTKYGDPPPIGNANDQHLESLFSTLLK